MVSWLGLCGLVKGRECGICEGVSWGGFCGLGDRGIGWGVNGCWVR